MQVRAKTFNNYKIQKTQKDGGNKSGQNQEQRQQDPEKKVRKRRSKQSSAAVFAQLNSSELIITPKLSDEEYISKLSLNCNNENLLKLIKLLNNGSEHIIFNVLKTFLQYIKTTKNSQVIHRIFTAISDLHDHNDMRIRLIIVMIFKEIRLKNMRSN